eukprot:CAMPEP_0119566338 /NCGR_PEP_ID=MMETSP1352-20130426/32764_1 /TAXON_ID=265584 /ORGANISM="Stauroneis constricta, Strain CCMP1120" /LENGTH=84 /DNA_ID=CAMNT_0007615425 /DNA_START=30 /DNA_END=281 /DNA_ORIENTATION=-
MKLCYELALPAEDDDGNDQQAFLDRKELFTNRAETVLRPLFRYSQYEYKESVDGDAAAASEIPQEPAATGSNATTAGGDDELTI